jgi:hypothetical protein
MHVRRILTLTTVIPCGLLYLTRHNGIIAKPQAHQSPPQGWPVACFPRFRPRGRVECGANSVRSKQGAPQEAECTANITRIVLLWDFNVAVRHPNIYTSRCQLKAAVQQKYAATGKLLQGTAENKLQQANCSKSVAPTPIPVMPWKEPRPLSPRPARIRYTAGSAEEKGPDANNTTCCKADTGLPRLPYTFHGDPCMAGGRKTAATQDGSIKANLWPSPYPTDPPCLWAPRYATRAVTPGTRPTQPGYATNVLNQIPQRGEMLRRKRQDPPENFNYYAVSSRKV